MKFAAIQHDIAWCDRDANFDHLRVLIAEAELNGAEFVLLTETFSTGFAVDQPLFAEVTGGPSSQFLASMAKEHHIWIGGTCPELSATSADGRPANTFVVVSPDGIEHRYEKIHPFTFGGEDQHVRSGSEFVTIDVGGLRVSLFVCYDLRFADEFWQRAKDTDVFLVPANWPESRSMHWLSLLQARAIENQTYVIGCNRVGQGGSLVYSGDSRIFDPYGETLAQGAPHEECILYADVTRERVTEVREKFRFLQDRRS
jgi:predicted amidohydrolase